jgi:hypothetical protein
VPDEFRRKVAVLLSQLIAIQSFDVTAVEPPRVTSAYPEAGQATAPDVPDLDTVTDRPAVPVHVAALTLPEDVPTLNPIFVMVPAPSTR